jgi:hypothetical protein
MLILLNCQETVAAYYCRVAEIRIQAIEIGSQEATGREFSVIELLKNTK